MGLAQAMHWTACREGPQMEGKGEPSEGAPHTKEGAMAITNDVLSTEVLRHGAYLCLTVPPDARRSAAAAPIGALAERLGLRNEFTPGAGHPPSAVAFVRRVGATPGAIADDELLRADVVIHVAAPTAAPVEEFCAEAARLLAPLAKPRRLGGVVR